MEIRTSKEIQLMVEDVKWDNQRANYDDKTTKIRTEFQDKKWIDIDIEKKLQNLFENSKKEEKKEYKKYPGKASALYYTEVGKQLAYKEVLELLKFQRQP